MPASRAVYASFGNHGTSRREFSDSPPSSSFPNAKRLTDVYRPPSPGCVPSGSHIVNDDAQSRCIGLIRVHLHSMPERGAVGALPDSTGRGERVDDLMRVSLELLPQDFGCTLEAEMLRLYCGTLG